MRKLCYTLFLFVAFNYTSNSQSYCSDFDTDMNGWEFNFTEMCRLGADTIVKHQISELPESIIPTQYGIKMEATNYSDDLFMYLKRKITGLIPNTEYNVKFDIEMGTKFYMYGMGECAMLKCGAVNFEPTDTVWADGYCTINIDKGNQSRPGKQMDTITCAAHKNPDHEKQSKYFLAQFSKELPFLVESDKNGEIWLIVGNEMSYEVYSQLYYNSIDVTLSNIISSVDIIGDSEILKIYPNPTSSDSKLTLSESSENLFIEVFNTGGKLIYQQKIESYSNGTEIPILLAHQKPGLYFIQVKTGEKVYREKVIRE